MFLKNIVGEMGISCRYKAFTRCYYMCYNSYWQVDLGCYCLEPHKNIYSKLNAYKFDCSKRN